MSSNATNPKSRFSNRVDNYVRFRPGYPAEVLKILEHDAGLTRDSIIADIGSGTGISTILFLDHGNMVYGVEPNREMRDAAEKFLQAYPRFKSVDGAAENTTLADRSVDFVVAGQAFHWFDRPNAKREFSRILRPGGGIVLMWNTRRMDTPLNQAYEALLHSFGSDYREIDHKKISTAAIEEFFAPAMVQLRKVPNYQAFDLEGLQGRIESCSYMPTKGHPGYAAMCEAIGRVFAQHQSSGQVRLEYETELYFGQFE